MLAHLRSVPFSVQVLLGLVLGVVLGLVARDLGPVADGSPNWLTSTVETIGSSFVSLGSAATAGTTGATVMLTLTLSTLGLPIAGVGLLLAVDPILVMGRTAVNVAGQALVPTIVAKLEGILDEQQFAAGGTVDAPATERVPVTV